MILISLPEHIITLIMQCSTYSFLTQRLQLLFDDKEIEYKEVEHER